MYDLHATLLYEFDCCETIPITVNETFMKLLLIFSRYLHGYCCGVGARGSSRNLVLIPTKTWKQQLLR